MGKGTAKDSPKFQSPQVINIYVRERIQSIFDNNKNSMWVAAPAGSGKTTAVAYSLRNTSTLWYRIDELDQDISAFFYYFNVLVENSNLTKTAQLPLYTPEYHGNIKFFARHYFRQVFNIFNNSAAIVFDNYQDAKEEPELNRVIKIAIEEAPKDIQIFVISRNQPAAIFSRLKLHNQLTVVDYDELRFTRHELDQMIGYLSTRTYSELEKEQIYTFTQGWITGLFLILEQAKDISLHGLNEVFNDQQAAFDYLASEVFDSLDKATRYILLKTAFLRNFTIADAEDITGARDVEEELSELINDRFFISTTTKSTTYYEYHPLLRMFLEDQAKKYFTKEEQVLIKNKTAEILNQSGEYIYAAQLYIETEDWENLIKIILNYSQVFINQGLQNTLARLISQIPSEIYKDNAWLILWNGVSQIAISLTSARTLFEEAYNKFKSKEDIDGLYLSWSGVIDTYIFEWNGFKDLDKWITEGEQLQKDYPDVSSQDISARFTFGMFAALMHRQPYNSEMNAWANKVKILIQYCPDISMRMMMGNLLLLYYNWWQGDMNQSKLLVDTLGKHQDADNLPPLTSIVWHSINASYSWLTGQSEAALASTQAGLDLSRESGIQLWDFMLYAQSVWASLIRGDITSADKFLNKMSTAHNHELGMNVGLYHDTAAIIELNKANYEKALTHAKMALEQAQVTGMYFAEAMTHLSCAMAYMGLGNNQKANKHLEQVTKIGSHMNSGYINFLSYFTQAQLFINKDDISSACESLKSGLQISKSNNLTIHVWFNLDNWTNLLIHALENDIEVEYVQSLIHKRSSTPKIIPQTLENWPWKLKIYTLGEFNIYLNNMEIDANERGINKPLEMLKVLISFGGKDVPEEKVMDTMWPDADGDQARSSFKTTLHRLRKVLDEPDVLKLNNGRLSLNEQYCWVDIWHLAQLLQQLTSLSTGPINETRKKLYLQIMQLYKGHFLANESASWSIHTRETVRLQFIRQVAKLAEDMEKGDPDMAIGCYQRLLEIDALIEAAYQGLIRVYKSQGHLIEAESLNKKYTDLLEQAKLQSSNTTFESK